MTHFGKPIILATVLALGLTGGASAQNADSGWLKELTFDMEFTHKCEVAYFLNIVERDEADGRFVSARVQCTDGRSFDAFKKPADVEFTVEACGVSVCENANDTKDKS